MQINHSDAKQQKADRLIPVGNYAFEVLSAEEKPSKKGQDMFAVKLAVYDADGRKRLQKDWMGAWDWNKLQVFCEATGLTEKYISGELDADDIIGARGTVHIKHAKNKVTDENESNVGWYVPARNGETVNIPAQAAPAEAETTDDEVPF